MAELKNIRHEAFCQAYAETDIGVESYRRTYGEKVKGAAGGASRLLKQVDIQTRIAEIRSEIAQRHEVTQDTLVAEYDEMIALAKQDPKSYGAAVNAINSKARITGHWVDKVQITAETLSDEELAEAIKGEQGDSIIPWDRVLRQSRGQR